MYLVSLLSVLSNTYSKTSILKQTSILTQYTKDNLVFLLSIHIFLLGILSEDTAIAGQVSILLQHSETTQAAASDGESVRGKDFLDVQVLHYLLQNSL